MRLQRMIATSLVSYWLNDRISRAIWGGALLTVAGWIIVSLGFLQLDFYFAVQQRFYGAGAAIIAMLLWFYITASLMILGLSFARFVIDGQPVPKHAGI